jgi:sulfopyruvate decarboxylase TPP-binding subunit
MNIVKVEGLRDVVKTVEICHCPFHRGETIEQIDAQLPNGKRLRVLLDRLGYHVATGNKYAIEQATPPGVDEAEAWKIISSALVS